MAREKKNSKFKKTVDEISKILKEEAEKQNTSSKKSQPAHETSKKNHRILFLGVIFFTLLISFFWASGLYSFFKENKNIKNESSKMINNTKQDLQDVLNTFSTDINPLANDDEEDKKEEVKQNNEKDNQKKSTTTEKIVNNILNEIKQINTSTIEVNNENKN